MLTVALLAALRHERELAIHVRAALDAGVTPEELSEVLLHLAVYAGAPAARSAFGIAADAVAERAAGPAT